MSSPPEVDLVPAISNKALKFACQLLNNLNFPNINHIWKKTSHFLNIEFLDKFVSYGMSTTLFSNYMNITKVGTD